MGSKSKPQKFQKYGEGMVNVNEHWPQIFLSYIYVQILDFKLFRSICFTLQGGAMFEFKHMQ